MASVFCFVSRRFARKLVSIETCSHRKKLYAEPVEISLKIGNSWLWVFYLLLLEETVKPKEERNHYTRPANNTPDQALAIEMALRLLQLTETGSDAKTLSELLQTILDHPSLWQDQPNLERSLKPIIDNQGVTAAHFSTYINHLQKAFNNDLPKNLAEMLLPTQIYDAEGVRLKVSGKINE